PGTEFLSLGTSWGPGLYSNTPAEVRHHQRFGPKDGRDIVRWEVSFVVSPTRKLASRPKAGAGTSLDPAVRKLIDRYSAGWDSASVVREGQTASYAGDPRLDVYAEDWLVYSMDDDIRIFHQHDPLLTIRLPVTINTREREFDPSLVRTHDGRYALLWARGTSKRNASRFVAVSADMLRWETPRRMMFEPPLADSGYTYSRAEPLERTYNVVPIQRGYAMLLAQGFVRYSEDLVNWGAPRKSIAQDRNRNRLLKTPDGAVWAVYE
ncbi:MAG: hypothetical protein GY953_30985, partial [bacterium]|nr:hypothetical protein [bacterium]